MLMLKVLLTVLLIASSGLQQHPVRPTAAKLVAMRPLSCGEQVIVMYAWDTNNRLDDGAEWVEVATLDGRVIVIVVLASDTAGRPLLYSVTVPGGAKWYHSAEAIADDYPSLCDILAQMNQPEAQ